METLESLNEKFESIGIKILSNFTAMYKPATFECNAGHIYEDLPVKALRRKKCPVCYGEAKPGRENYHNRLKADGLERLNNVLTEQGIRMIGEYKNRLHTTKFECSKGHVFEESAHRILIRKKACPVCNLKISQKGLASCIPAISREERLQSKIDAINEKLKSKKIRLISGFSRMSRNALFECEHGHTFERRVSGALISRGCPVCPKSEWAPLEKPILSHQKLTRIEVKARFLPYDFMLIGEYNGMRELAKFQCEAGHIFERTPDAALNLKGCPSCRDSSSPDMDRLKAYAKELHENDLLSHEALKSILHG
ncbi:TPA: hypothetical protein LU109_003622 [Enterobacter hormaechei subsp. xiangfangensis]|nr:hypothetical protein [Enterobacter hormaechei subsp. xiangfangensis]